MNYKKKTIFILALLAMPFSSCSSNNNSSYLQAYLTKKNVFPFVDETFVYNEYYAKTSNSYLRFYENGHFQYDSPEGTFFASYSRFENYYIVNNYLFNKTESGDVSNFTKDMFFFEINDDSCHYNKSISLINSGFDLLEDSYQFNKSSLDKTAIYRYEKEIADEFIIKLKTKTMYANKDLAIKELGLSEFNNALVSFSNANQKSSLSFVFSLEKIDIKQTMSSYINKYANNLIDQIDFSFNDVSIIQSTNLDALGLSNANLVNDCIFIDEINSHKYLLEQEAAENGLLLTSVSDANEYIDVLNETNNGRVDYNQTINFLRSMTEDSFANKNIVLSSMLLLNDSEVSYTFKNAYLKEDTLYLSFDKISGDYAYQVVSYSTFAFQIAKDITFNRIVTIF